MPTQPTPPDLTRAIIELLPAVNGVTAAHLPDAANGHPCPHCTSASRPDCPHLWLAAAALDLIIRCRRMTQPQSGNREV